MLLKTVFYVTSMPLNNVKNLSKRSPFPDVVHTIEDIDDLNSYRSRVFEMVGELGYLTDWVDQLHERLDDVLYNIGRHIREHIEYDYHDGEKLEQQYKQADDMANTYNAGLVRLRIAYRDYQRILSDTDSVVNRASEGSINFPITELDSLRVIINRYHDIEHEYNILPSEELIADLEDQIISQENASDKHDKHDKLGSHKVDQYANTDDNVNVGASTSNQSNIPSGHQKDTKHYANLGKHPINLTDSDICSEASCPIKKTRHDGSGTDDSNNNTDVLHGYQPHGSDEFNVGASTSHQHKDQGVNTTIEIHFYKHTILQALMASNLQNYLLDLSASKSLSSILRNHDLVLIQDKISNTDVSILKEELINLLSEAKARLTSINSELNDFENIATSRKKIKTEPISPLLETETKLEDSIPILEGVVSSKNVAKKLFCAFDISLLIKKEEYDSIKNFNKNTISYRKKAKKNEKQIVHNDYSRVKITTQIPANTFSLFLDNYFSFITDNDILYLEKSDNDPSIFEINTKGTHYLIKWAENEAKIFPDLSQVAKIKASITRTVMNSFKSKIEMDKPVALDQIDDNELIAPTIRCPPLTERLLSALVDQRVVINNKLDNEKKPVNNSVDSDDDLDYVPNLEEQLKQELRYIGILDSPEIDWKNTEDDEVAAELRQLQDLLKAQQSINNSRKLKLASVARDYLGYQEYKLIMEELDKQIEQSYLKRNRSLKSKKKKTIAPRAVPVSTNLMSLIDRRNRFLECIGPIFTRENFVNITHSIFEEKDNVKLPFKHS
ncbi:hypothetical protein BB561_003826 [Smittium simulii]|uniref:Uncharacterized protein n=1 Tax=Smittium simulii TaxID=133385 RepID=A0A2T9YJG8_9FUNG|nr:hypothetical protein BB561_003826 [Smittium simulii]